MKLFLYIFSLLVLVAIAMIIYVSVGESVNASGLTVAGVLIFFLVLLIRSSVSRSKPAGSPAVSSNDKQEQGPEYFNSQFRFEDSRKVVIALGVGAYLLAVVDFFSNQSPSPIGRWGWFNWKLYELFGSLGLPIWWSVVGTILLVFGLRKKRP